MTKIIYFLGLLLGKRFRRMFYKKGKAYWGARRWTQEHTSETECNSRDVSDLIKRLIFLFLVPAMLFGRNFGREYGDTAYIPDTLQTDTLKYTRLFTIDDKEQLRVVVMANDTSVAGLTSDSIYFDYGYQLGELVLNSSGNRDTAWGDKIQIDSMVLDSFGKVNVGTMVATGVLTSYYGGVDTSTVSGYAIKVRRIAMDWGQVWGSYIRFWAKGRARNRKGKILLLCFDLKYWIRND